MPDVLVTPCTGRIITVDSSCGCSLTRATVLGLSSDDVVALGYKEIYLTQAILAAKEAKMLGVPERGLMELLTSSTRDISKMVTNQKVDEQSIIQPYIMRNQRSVMNANYVTIESGAAASDAGTGSVPTGAWEVIVNMGPSWLKTNFNAMETFFVAGDTFQIFTWDSAGSKVARTLVFTIYRAINADAGGTFKAKITLVPPMTSAKFTSLSTPEKLVWQPTFGVGQTGANSVNGFESYCPQQRADINNNLIINWLQETRESYCREQSYEEILDLIMKGKVNDYLKGFRTLSIADQEKQKAARYRRNFYNTVFFGTAIDIYNQTEANWRNLPQVYDPVSSGTCPLAYKASAEGIFTQLLRCNRVIDMAGGLLDLKYVFAQLYYLRRNREADGDSIQTIDSMTDRYTGAIILEVMTKYYTQVYGITNVRQLKTGEAILHENVVLFNYNIYQIEEAGVNWAVFIDDYFNDLIDAYNTSISGNDFRTRARNLWFLDWSDIAIGVAGTKHVTRKTPDPKTSLLYTCVIDETIKTYDLRSKIFTVMVDRPQRHMIIHNFSSGCPIVPAGHNCLVPQS